MIWVLADSSEDATLIEEAVDGAVRVLNGSSGLAGRDGQIECVVLGFRSPVLPGRLQLVRQIGREMPWVPVILVTDPTPDAARWLRERHVSDIVWFEEVKTELDRRVETRCRTGVLFAFAEEIESSRLPPTLRRGVAHSLRAATDHPLRNVKELAHVLGRSPVTLSQAFRTRVSSDATLSQFLNALVVVRAHQLRKSGLTWESVGRTLGFTRPTLHSKSKRWPAQTLKHLARVPRGRLMTKFGSDYIQPLLKRDTPPL